jgi:hypothetical protein
MFKQFSRNRFGRQGAESRPGAGRGRGFGRGAGGSGGGGRGGGNKPGSGPGGYCACPKCGKKVAHVAGQRCIDQVCPDCGTKLIRE